MGYSHEVTKSQTQLSDFTAFFIVQLSHPYMTTGKTIALTRWTFVDNEFHEKTKHRAGRGDFRFCTTRS